MAKEMNFRTKVQAICTLVLVLMVAAANGCADEPQPKNRVPTVPAQVEEAQAAAKDAQASADRASQSVKDIQASINKLDANGRNSDGSWKVGQAQLSGIGTVTEVGETKVPQGEGVSYTLWFTFSERAGYVKKFSPVCPNQEIPVNATVILNFHWKEYESEGKPGCYLIDGHTVVK